MEGYATESLGWWEEARKGPPNMVLELRGRPSKGHRLRRDAHVTAQECDGTLKGRFREKACEPRWYRGVFVTFALDAMHQGRFFVPKIQKGASAT